MKKQMITVTSVAMALMLTLAGCTGSGNSQNADNNSNAGAAVVQPDNKAANQGNDWFEAAREFHAAHVEGHENERNVDTYAANFTVDGIPGELHYTVGNNSWFFEYNFDTFYPYVNYQFDFDENKGGLSFYDSYSDGQVFQIMTFLTGKGESEIDTAVDEILNGQYDKCNILNDEALSDHEEDIMADNKVLYARMCYMITELFKDMGLDYEDGNIYLASKYMNYDFAGKLCIEAGNEHKFVDGFCEDCDMTWNEYMNECVNTKGDLYCDGDNALIGYADDEAIQYTSNTVSGYVDLGIGYFYYPSDNEIENLSLDLDDEKGTHEKLYFTYNYFYDIQDDNGATIKRYVYSIEGKRVPYEDLGEILSDKNSILENSEYSLVIIENGEITSLDHELTKDEIKEFYGDNGNLYLDFEQLADKLAVFNALERIDTALVEFDTSLADDGISVK